MSLAVPERYHQACQSRAIPIGFHHCPTPKKPVKHASLQEILIYKEVKKQSRLSLQRAHKINDLRQTLDQQGHGDRTLCVSGDGSYTNATVLKNMPERTVLVGRIRKLLRRSKWYPAKNKQRFTSGDLVNQLRVKLWAKAPGCVSFSGFVASQHQTKSQRNSTNPLTSAILYSRR